jgi:hypothetical protein
MERTARRKIQPLDDPINGYWTLTNILLKQKEPLCLVYLSTNLPFIGLPDPKASVLKLYGQVVNLFKLGRMPAQVLIDKAGGARFVHYGHSMSDIPSNQEILALADEINK